MMEYDIHTLLDLLTLATTLYTIYIVRVPLKATYQADLDNVNHLYIVSCFVIEEMRMQMHLVPIAALPISAARNFDYRLFPAQS